jgi:hypothetical protein
VESSSSTTPRAEDLHTYPILYNASAHRSTTYSALTYTSWSCHLGSLAAQLFLETQAPPYFKKSLLLFLRNHLYIQHISKLEFNKSKSAYFAQSLSAACLLTSAFEQSTRSEERHLILLARSQPLQGQRYDHVQFYETYEAIVHFFSINLIFFLPFLL